MCFACMSTPMIEGVAYDDWWTKEMAVIFRSRSNGLESPFPFLTTQLLYNSSTSLYLYSKL